MAALFDVPDSPVLAAPAGHSTALSASLLTERDDQHFGQQSPSGIAQIQCKRCKLTAHSISAHRKYNGWRWFQNQNRIERCLST